MTQVLKSDGFHGVIVYEIIRNGNTLILNGIYTNTAKGKKPEDDVYVVNNEIAKRKIENECTDLIPGEYSLRYIDSELVEGTLVIKKEVDAYSLIWTIKSDVWFTGIGIYAGPNHFAVSYIKKDQGKKE